ncbi:hypothetical protein L3N51_02113 [Metallosphaera sp. J1]|nr:hypothetical protein [Metallosphaera javensis (ex Hofmann et al. 2022)]
MIRNLKMKIILLVTLLVLALVPLTSSQTLVQNVIYNVQSVDGVFHSNVTGENYMVGEFQGEIYVWENASPVPLGQGVVRSAGLEGDYVVVEGYVVVNGTPLSRMWILNVLNNGEMEVPLSGNYMLIGNVGDYLLLSYNESSGIYMTALDMSTGKFLDVSIPLGQGSEVEAVMVNSTGDSANLLVWSSNGGVVQVETEQLFLLSGTIISSPPETLVSAPGKVLVIHGGLVVEGSQSYVVTDSGKVLYVPGLTSVAGGWISGTAFILNGSSLVVASSTTSVILLPSPGQLVIPGPFNVSYVISGDQTYVVRDGAIVSSTTFTATSLLYESEGTAYLLSPGELEEMNLFTGGATETPIQGVVEGFVPLQGGILVYTLVNDAVYVYLASSPGFTASITLNYPGYWILELGNVEVNVTGTVSLVLPSQQYAFTAQPEPGYNSIRGELSPGNSTLVFTPVKSLYTLLIVGFGVPRWSVEIGDSLMNSTGLLVLSEPVGTYQFRVIPPAYYNYTVKVVAGQLSNGEIKVSPSSSSLELNGRTYHNVSLYLEINFTEERFTLHVEVQGLSHVTLDLNGTVYNITGNSTLYLLPGVYFVKAFSPAGYNVTYPLKVNVPLNTTLTITFIKNMTRPITPPPTSNVTKAPPKQNLTIQPTQTPGISPLGISPIYLKVISLLVFIAVAIIIAFRVK